MSTLITQARSRVPRFAEAAVERARLTVVPPRRQLGRTQAARTPFAVLVIGMLVAGVVGLLMFNTNMQQASFTATALQNQATALTAKQQSLSLELDALRDPQHLAVAAKALGMVAPAEPAFVRLSDGRILGKPTPATPADAVRINPLPSQTPASLKRKKVIVHAPVVATPPTVGSKAAGSQADTRGASTTTGSQGDRKKARTSTTDHVADPGATH